MVRCKVKIQKPVRKRMVKIKKGTPKIECTFYGNWRVLVPFHLHQKPRQNKLAPNLHQRQIFCKRKTPKTVVVSGFFDNRRKALIISWRTEERDERPSDRTSFSPSFWGRGSGSQRPSEQRGTRGSARPERGTDRDG